MRILVYDVAASNRGALSVLMDFYRQVVSFGGDTEWHFVISTPELEETEHVHIHRYPWIKRDPISRVYFDTFYIQRLIRELRIDQVLSLQNVCVSRCSLPQMISLHNALPFHKCDSSVLSGAVSILKQRYLNRKVLRSLVEAKRVFVPNDWIFASCARVKGVDAAKLRLVKPNLPLPPVIGQKNTALDGPTVTFYYPANAEPYKRHDMIYRACRKMQERGYTFQVLLTARGNENAYIKSIKDGCEKNGLPVEFHGNMSREDVYRQYGCSVLLFPSEIETDALPLIEAMLCGAFIIAAQTDFAECILKDYPNTILVPMGDGDALAEAMGEVLDHKRVLVPYEQEVLGAVGDKNGLVKAVLHAQ